MRKDRTRVSRSKSFNGTALVEALERRQLMAVTLGTNIIANPGAESSATVATGWTANGTPQVVAYGASGGFPTSTSPGPTSRGKNFFAGGSGSEADLFQTIDVSSLGSSIDAGQIKYALQGYLGGFSSQADDATVFLNFQSSSKSLVNQVSIGPVTPANRNNVTGLLLRTLNGSIPKTTRFIQVQIHFEVISGGFDDGYADELSLKLSSTVAATGGISGTVYNDANGNATKDSSETGISGVKVFLDTNKNGTADSGELSTTTSSTGAYTFSSLAAGSYTVREVVPSGSHATTTNPLTVTVSTTVSSGHNFGDEKNPVTGGISGTVFNDLDGDGVKDSNETAGVSGVKVFIDKNKNGVLDSGEASTTTSSAGAYTFTGLAAGSYTVREVVPATYRATTANPLTVTVTAGSTTASHNFGDSQTALISGTVFNDANGNKTKDSTENGIAAVTVYLDFNNNGQLDSFELKTTTDASGNYKFIVPFGTYVVRQVTPSGKTQTTPSSSYSVNLTKGQTSTGKNFGDK